MTTAVELKLIARALKVPSSQDETTPLPIAVKRVTTNRQAT
jgi:hypothetical protein